MIFRYFLIVLSTTAALTASENDAVQNSTAIESTINESNIYDNKHDIESMYKLAKNILEITVVRDSVKGPLEYFPDKFELYKAPSNQDYYRVTHYKTTFNPTVYHRASYRLKENVKRLSLIEYYLMVPLRLTQLLRDQMRTFFHAQKRAKEELYHATFYHKEDESLEKVELKYEDGSNQIIYQYVKEKENWKGRRSVQSGNSSIDPVPFSATN